MLRVERQAIGEIGKGLLVYLGIEEGDQKDDLDWVLKKLLGIRIFDDSEGKMNESLKGEDGIMLISQFTLFGEPEEGVPTLLQPGGRTSRRPSIARRIQETAPIGIRGRRCRRFLWRAHGHRSN